MAAPIDENLRSQIAATTRAVEYARRSANIDSTKLELLVEHLHSLAELRVRTGDFSRAESLLREAMFRIEDANSVHRIAPRPILAANIASSLGYLYDRWNKTENARSWYQKSLDMAETGHFFESDLGASVSNNLGMLDKRHGALASAEFNYRRALDIFKKIKGSDSLECAAVTNNLGVLLYTQGDYPGAIQCHEAAMAIRQAHHNPATGEGLKDLCQSWRNLAAVYKTQGEAEKAATLLRQAGVSEEPSESATTNWVVKPTSRTTLRSDPRPSTSSFSVEVHRPDKEADT